MGRIVEGLWDCSYCGTKGLSGGADACPHCGKHRDNQVRFYMPNQISYVDESIADKISRKPDWLCTYCQSMNSDNLTTCKTCGAVRNSENLNYFQNKEAQEKQSNNTFEKIGNEPNTFKEPENQTSEHAEDNHSTNSGSVHEEDAIKADSNENYEKTKFQRFCNRAKDLFSSFLDVVLENIPIAVAIVLIIGVVFALVPKTKEVTIDQKFWERSVEIEVFKTVDESGWSLPDGARLHDSKTEVYRYDRVIDHYEDKTRQVSHQRITGYRDVVVGYRDLGNGYFEEIKSQEPIYETYYETEHYSEPVYRQQPVYKTKYYYEIDKWVYDRTLTSSGTDNEPYWCDTSELSKNERTGKEKGTYSVYVITSKGTSMEIDLPYDQWSTLSKGESVKMKVSIFGNGKIITKYD